MRKAKSPQQQSFTLRAWGGKRRNAGRPPAHERRAVPHEARREIRAWEPVHLSLRVADPVWNLRSERSFVVLDGALRAAQRRPGFRIVHFTILGNHLHLIVEAQGTRTLGNAIRALSIRVARGLNAMMGRTGPVFADRYHAHVLRTPAEVRNALRYVVGNFASHAKRRGEPVTDPWVDPYSSANVKAPRVAQGSLFVEPIVRPPETWLLKNAGRR